MTDAALVSGGGWLLLAGALIFFVGVSFGVPRVFVRSDPEERLAMLEVHARAWRASQWFYAGGPLVAALGVLVAATGWQGQVRVLAASAGTAMLVGAVLFAISCARRGRRIPEFARGQLPAGSWNGYVWLTLLGLAMLGAAILGLEPWVGILLLVATAAFTAVVVVTRDIPPFAFYLVLTVVGAWCVLAVPR